MSMNTTFFDVLPPETSFYLDIQEPVEIARTSGGDIISASLGAALWFGSLQLSPMRHRDALTIEVTLSSLMRPGQAVEVKDPKYVGPRGDPTGSILGASTPTLGTISADRRSIDIAGLPVGYALSGGDKLSFTYGSGPERVAFHEVTTFRTASAGGVITAMGVNPAIRAWPTSLTGSPIKLVRPGFKARITEGKRGTVGPVVVSGTQFSFIQLVR